MIRDAEGTIVEFERGDVVWGIDPFKQDATAGDEETGERVVPRPWLVISTEAVPFHPEQYICVTLTTRTWHDDAVPLTEESWEEGGAPAKTSIMPWAVAAIKHDYLDTTGELVTSLAVQPDDSLTNGFQGRLTADVVDQVTENERKPRRSRRGQCDRQRGLKDVDRRFHFRITFAVLGAGSNTKTPQYSTLMRRTNRFTVVPRSPEDEELLRRLLDASASLWNALTFERRQQLFAGESVWETADYRKRYVGVLGSATAQQVIRKNTEAWRSFFAACKNGEETAPPGYWGNEEEGRELRSVIRNDQYTLRWGKRSTIEISVGKHLKVEYGLGYRERLTLDVRGCPTWAGKQGRLEIQYDGLSDRYSAFQPVTVDDARQDSPLADETAALDIGANTLVACTTTTGQQYLYAGREQFRRFRATTTEIARLQSKLEEGRYTSTRIRRLYRRRTRRRDHAMDALARDLMGRLNDDGVSMVYVGDLTDVLRAHWSVRVNEKTHNFWAFRAFVDRLACTAEEYGISVEVRSEAWTSRECPDCRSIEDTTRHRDTLSCLCGFEGHADLTASETFLRRQETDDVRPMARPVCLRWDDHRWSASPRAHRPNEEHTNPQVTAGASA